MPEEFPIKQGEHLNRLKLMFQSTPGQKQFNFPDQIGTNGDNPLVAG